MTYLLHIESINENCSLTLRNEKIPLKDKFNQRKPYYFWKSFIQEQEEESEYRKNTEMKISQENSEGNNLKMIWKQTLLAGYILGIHDVLKIEGQPPIIQQINEEYWDIF